MGLLSAGVWRWSPNYRLSDWVSCVCLPLVFILYINLNILQAQLQQQSLRQADVEDSALHVTSEHHVTYRIDNNNVLPPVPEILIPPPLNISSSANGAVLIFTPIKGAGSTAVKNLLSFLRKDNHFKLYSEPIKRTQEVHIRSQQVKQKIVRNLTKFSQPSVFVHSFAFIDFESYGAPQPLQVSLVRHPVERAISLFYRARSPYQLVENYRQFPDVALPNRKFLKKSLEMCLEAPSDSECRHTPGSTIQGNTINYFCGHEEECTKFGSEIALEKAKSNVNKFYSVIGLLEHLPVTLAVLERYLPRYFNGATEKYYDKIVGQQSMMNENFYKPKVDDWARKMLSENFTVEEKFYEFLKARLYEQYNELQR